MEVGKSIALCVAAAVACLSLRAYRPEWAVVTALAAGLCAAALALPLLSDAIAQMRTLMQVAGAQTSDMTRMLRACGIALIAEYAAQLCRDAGEGGLAQRVEFAARCALLAIGVPMLTEMLTTLSGWLA